MSYIKTYRISSFDTARILRYARTDTKDKNTVQLINDCVAELSDKCVMKVCYEIFDVKRNEGHLDLGFSTTDSKSLSKHIEGCGRIVLFAATVGFAVDRMIRKYTEVSPSRAYIFQAIGTERIECLCDAFENDIVGEFKHTRCRFSPGYGDLPIELQRDIFDALNVTKTLGITLNESMLMMPSKSVTGIIGLIGEKQ